jgi:hypothetical protein
MTGTSVNPARSLGPALVVGGRALRQVGLYIVAPLIGGVLAARLECVRLGAGGVAGKLGGLGYLQSGWWLAC